MNLLRASNELDARLRKIAQATPSGTYDCDVCFDTKYVCTGDNIVGATPCGFCPAGRSIRDGQARAAKMDALRAEANLEREHRRQDPWWDD